MKRFSIIVLFSVAAIGLSYALAFAGPGSLAQKATSACASVGCQCPDCLCPDCNGEFCTCEVCECGPCGCAQK